MECNERAPRAKEPRLLGWAFVFQFITSFTSMAILLPMATGVQGLAGGSVNIGPMLSSLASHPTLVYLNILGELLTAAGVIFLAALLYRELKRIDQALALTASGLYLAQAVLLAQGRIILYALFLLAQHYVASGSPAALESSGRLLYEAMTYSSTVLNLLFCLGGLIFYGLLFRSRRVPRPLSLWGLVSLLGVLVGTSINLVDGTPPLFLFLAYIPFEPVIGVWIIVKGLETTTIKKEKT